MRRHRIHAAAYDTMTGPLERAVLGRLIVLEHVRGSGSLARRQDRLTPVWSRINAGCHLNRDIAAAVRRAGFTIETAESFDPYPRWVPARPLLEAVAAAARER